MLRCALAVVVCAGVAHAESTVTITLNQQGREMADQIGASVPMVIADAQGRIDALFELQGLPHLLNSFANTGAFANHALGVDYPPDPGDLMFGVVADSAIAADARLSSDKVFSATVINYGILAGANLGRWNHPRWTISANGSYASTTIRGLSGHLVSGGAHVQYLVLPGRERGAVRWTGLAATTGLEYSRWEIGLASTLNTHITVTGTRDRATVDMASNGTLTVVSTTTAVPIQVTTGVRFGNLIGLYGGGGLTFAGGTATVTAALDTLLTINADDLPIGTAQITASDSNGPTGATVHALAGIQLHTRHVRVFVQGLIAPDERGVSVGLRAGL
jgi:hypothetical protein